MEYVQNLCSQGRMQKLSVECGWTHNKVQDKALVMGFVMGLGALKTKYFAHKLS